MAAEAAEGQMGEGLMGKKVWPASPQGGKIMGQAGYDVKKEPPQEKEFRVRVKDSDRKLLLGLLLDKIESIATKKRKIEEKDIKPYWGLMQRFRSFSIGTPSSQDIYWAVEGYHYSKKSLNFLVLKYVRELREEIEERQHA